MKQIVGLLLSFSLLSFWSPGWTKGAPEGSSASSETSVINNSNKNNDDSSHETQFRLVDSEQIVLDSTAVWENNISVKQEVNRKIRSEYVPIRLTIINKSGKLLEIPEESIYFLDSQGIKKSIPSDKEIFDSVKRHGVRRAAAWSIPLGVASFGFLLIPAAVWSGAHTKITNGSIKSNLERSLYKGGHLSPEGGITTFLYAPKKESNISKIVLGRVINIEDNVETQKVIDIQDLEMNNAANK